ncbi:hypothetical protein [Nostoc sp.]|uniref:hypothetical protein n=1 Tax=Nostoc sp. TaxID=1180 RepID=UPI0035940F5E
MDETDWEERKLDIHHIFPKSWCDKQGIPASRYNSILNSFKDGECLQETVKRSRLA